MKSKSRISVILGGLLCLISFSSVAKAQLYAGGSLGYQSSGVSTASGSTTVNGKSTTAITLSPEVGYYLNQNLAVGISLSFLSNSVTTPIGTTSSTIDLSNTYMFTPYARYHVLRSGSFSFFGEGSIGIGGQVSQTTKGNTIDKGPSVGTFALAVSPGISYDLSEKFCLIAKLGNIGYQSSSSSTTNTIGTTSTTTTITTSSFGINVGLNALSFGAIMKF